MLWVSSESIISQCPFPPFSVSFLLQPTVPSISFHCSRITRIMEDEDSNVGFRFHPKDHELVDFFLWHKMRGNDSKVSRIGELNITDFEPWELPAKSVVQSEDQEWYFFCPRKPKYSTGRRSQRNTKSGQWKITGKERKVKRRGTNVVIGTKRTLVFYEGRAGAGPAPTRTNWVMHEYSPVNTNDSGLKPYALCLVKKKLGENDIPTHAGTERSGYETEPSHTPVASITLFDNGDESSIPEFYEHQEPDMDSLFDQPQKVDFSDLQQLMQEEQGPSNVEYSDYNGLQFQSDFGDEEVDIEFLNSVIVDGNGINCLSRQSISNESSQTESLMREYGDRELFSSDTDVEVFQPRYRQILEGLSNELAGSKGKTHTKQQLAHRTESSVADHYHSVVEEPFAAQCQSLFYIRPAQKGEANVNRSTISLQGDFFLGKESAAESSNDVHVLKKGLSNVKLDTGSELHQEIEEKLTLKSRFNGNTKASFIVMEAPMLDHKARSPSVYFVNALVGAVLSMVMVWELVMIGGSS